MWTSIINIVPVICFILLCTWTHSLDNLTGMGDPRVARDPSGHEFGHEIVPVAGHGFLSGHISY
jgi:hypothetical protein